MFTVLFITVCAHAVGLIVFGHFEAHTPIWRRVLKLAFNIGLTALISSLAGPVWALTAVGLWFAAGLVVHFVWTSRHGIDPFTAEPRERYYALRGWR